MMLGTTNIKFYMWICLYTAWIRYWGTQRTKVPHHTDHTNSKISDFSDHGANRCFPFLDYELFCLYWRICRVKLWSGWWRYGRRRHGLFITLSGNLSGGHDEDQQNLLSVQSVSSPSCEPANPKRNSKAMPLRWPLTSKLSFSYSINSPPCVEPKISLPCSQKRLLSTYCINNISKRLFFTLKEPSVCSCDRTTWQGIIQLTN